MKQNLLLLLGHIAFWLLIDCIFQISANRAFTFVDDHTIISTYDFIHQFGVWPYIKEVLQDSERFRPMMGINRTLYVSFLGKEIHLISYYFLLLAGVTGFFLHKFAAIIGFGLKKSLLFTALVLVGMQGVIWWVFDSSENIALLFMSIALYSGYRGFVKKQTAWLAIPIFWTATVLMSLSKESFIFILPFFAILFYKNRLVFTLLLVLCLLELLYIKFFIGTTFGYAGVDTATYSLYNISRVIAQYLIRGYGIPLLVVVGFLSYQHRSNLKSFWLGQKFYLLAVVFGVLPFLLVYAKSGINVGRYLLPLLIPQIYVVFQLVSQVEKFRYRIIIGFCIFLFFGYHLNKFAQLQHNFVTENKEIEQFSKEITSQTTAADEILLLANPVEDYEKAGALLIYLNSSNALDRKKTRLEPVYLSNYDRDLPITREFLQRNNNALNVHPLNKYEKWLVLNDDVLNEIVAKGLLKEAHQLVRNGSYSIIVFNK